MTQIERTIPAGAGQIFDVLADGWSYAAWVVGNSHVRDVDPEWPEQAPWNPPRSTARECNRGRPVEGRVVLRSRVEIS